MFAACLARFRAGSGIERAFGVEGGLGRFGGIQVGRRSVGWLVRCVGSSVLGGGVGLEPSAFGGRRVPRK